MPKKQHLDYLEKDPSKVHAQCYDMVLNGIEIASGSIRIHRADIQERVMKVIGLEKKDAERKFGFLLEAFKYGAPPHGGFAPGVDRLVALMLGHNDIREVIAFPKNKNAECPMDGCPTMPDEKVLKELNMKFTVEKK
jgi:aspartyl-tRNA synthetase